ncbi:MAG TPA: hypothetical protein VIV40_13300 [Kofleriaceae bacterium]
MREAHRVHCGRAMFIDGAPLLAINQPLLAAGAITFLTALGVANAPEPAASLSVC